MEQSQKPSKKTRSDSPYIRTEYDDGALGYIQRPTNVSPEIRDYAFTLYPALKNHPNARAYRGIFDYCNTSTFYLLPSTTEIGITNGPMI